MDPASKISAWNIPFDRIISLVPRLQPRYYSISHRHPSYTLIPSTLLPLFSSISPARAAPSRSLRMANTSLERLQITCSTSRCNQHVKKLVSNNKARLRIMKTHVITAALNTSSKVLVVNSSPLKVAIAYLFMSEDPTSACLLPQYSVVMIGPGTVSYNQLDSLTINAATNCCVQ